MTPTSSEPVFRCCGTRKTAESTGYRVVDGKRQPYCRGCRNARVVRGRRQKQQAVGARPSRIPQSDQGQLFAAQAALYSAFGRQDPGARKKEILEPLRAVYQLGKERGRSEAKKKGTTP